MKFKLLSSLIVATTLLTACETSVQSEATSTIESITIKKQITDLNISSQQTLGDLDHLGRSTFSHIILSNKDQPKENGKKRPQKINVNPSGWANQKVNGEWTNNRCHMVGYQFGGLTDEVKNLFTCTAYLNKGTDKKGTDQTNQESMLFYEQQLDQWLEDNPDKYLEYLVVPNYIADELVPRTVTLYWVGLGSEINSDKPLILTKQGWQINTETKSIEPIILKGEHITVLPNGVSTVTLNNSSPSFNLDYNTGYVKKK